MYTQLKKVIKTVLGDRIAFQMSEIKAKWFPGKEQRHTIKIDEQDIKKRQLFYGSFVKKNDLCFDVGANMGNRITPLLNIGAKIIAVEPQDECCKYLKLKFGKRIEIVPKGLGETEDLKNFYVSSANVLSSFSDEWINAVKDDRFKEHNWNEPVKVQITSLDKLIEKYGMPAFIKIDVEGYELEVLKGLTKPVKMISFEYTVPEQTNRAILCIEQIHRNNPEIECNYSIGESMTLALRTWLSAEDMKSYLLTKEFISSGFGDLYVKTKNFNS